MTVSDGPRHRARRLALQLLYQLDMGGWVESVDETIVKLDGVSDELLTADAKQFALEISRGVEQERSRIDAKIEVASEHWRLSRMASIDRNVLRIAVYEMGTAKDFSEKPVAVIIDEAIELAKAFGSEESPRFVNGILNRIAREMTP